MPSETKKVNRRKSVVPETVVKFVLSETASDNFIDLCDEFYFTVTRIGQAAELFRDIFNKKVKVASLPLAMKKRMELDKDRADFYAQEFAGRYLLVADEYFEGQVKAFIEKAGGDLVKYQEFTDEYSKKIEDEVKVEKEEKVKESVSEKVNPLEGLGEISDEDPEIDVKDMVNVLNKYVLTTYNDEDLLNRVDYNIVITSLLLIEKSYHHQFLQAMLTNAETIGTHKIKHKGEVLSPTIGHWLKDFDVNTRDKKDEKISTLSKAKYYNENENIQKLKPEERKSLDKVFDLYENIRNFYSNVERMDLSDVQIFPFSDKDQQDFLEKYGQSVEDKTEEETSTKTKDIFEMYMGEAEDREEMEQAEAEIVEKTGKERNKLAEWLYTEIIARHRINIVAGLKVAIENGLLDDFISKDPRYIDLMEAHYKRNSLVKELESFNLKKSSPDHIKNFLKYLLTERLGMLENHAARVAVQYSNIYRSQGNHELAQLAYYDVETGSFKWM